MTVHDTSLLLLSSSSKFIKKITYQIHLGFSCALRGFICSWNNTYVWEAQQRSLFFLLLCTCLIYITLYFSFLPFRFTIWLISFAYTFAPSTIEWFERASSARELLFKLISFVPLIGVFIMNNLLGTCLYFILLIFNLGNRRNKIILRIFSFLIGYEKLFFSVLESANPSLAKRLNCRARQSFIRSLYFFLRRTMFIFSIIIGIHFFRFIPILSQFISALWIIQYAGYTPRNTRYVYLLIRFIPLLILLTISESFHSYTLSLLHSQMAITALARELFDTYIARIYTNGKVDYQSINIERHIAQPRYYFLGFLVPALFHPDSNWQIKADVAKLPDQLSLPHDKITHFLRDNYFILLAFAFPFIFLFSIPLIGFFCIGFAHGAAAYTLAVIAQ